MQFLDSGGGRVALLRFLPDGRLLSIVTGEDRPAFVDLWSLPGAERLRIPLGSSWVQTFRPDWDQPFPDHRADVNAVAVHPGGESFFIAWAGQLLQFRTADGTPLPSPVDDEVHQVIISPGGDRLVLVRSGDRQVEFFAVALDGRGRLVWRAEAPTRAPTLAGFLPDGERFVTVDGEAVRVCAFADNTELATTRYPAGSVAHPLLSADGAYLGVRGYTSLYVFETAKLGKPRRISGSSAFGNFVSFAFHPRGGQLAVIHGGPTLVKVYDLATLKLVTRWKWKLGALESVAFSPDGCLGAAGSRDGRIVLWDVDE